jgi:hypothetical protein
MAAAACLARPSRSVRLDPDLKRDLLLRAFETDISVSDTIRELLRN